MKFSACFVLICSLHLFDFFSLPGAISMSRGEKKSDPVSRDYSRANPHPSNISVQINCHSVTNYFPRIGYSGYGVTLTGQNLDGVSGVKFANNVTASFEIINSTEIRTIIPLGAVSGPITISKTGCSDVTTDTFTIPPVPAISLTPLIQFVSVGDSTTIRVNFSRGLIVPATLGLSSSNPAVVSVPSFLPIPPGAISATFEATGLSQGAAATITATLPSNLGGASATAAVNITTRVVSLRSITALTGATVRIPIEIVAQNEESVVNFSVSFNPTLLANPQLSLGADVPTATLSTVTGQVSQGLLGVRLEMPSGLTIGSGTKQLAILQFEIPSAAPLGAANVRFDDQPVERSVIASTGVPLPTFFRSGVVTIAQGFEADSAPRPNGDGALNTADWVQIGRFISGVDAVPTGTEFQRADCAPRATMGDGVLSVTDWVQAGRYISKSDAMSVAGGPTSPSSTAFVVPNPHGSQDRFLRLHEMARANEIALSINATGNENGIGFSLQFDPKKIRFLSLQKDLLPAGATVILNESDAAQGKIGILLALAHGEKLPRGLQSILKLAFLPMTAADETECSIGFGDFPVPRQISDVGANPLPAHYLYQTTKDSPTGLPQREFPISPTAFPIAFIDAYRPSAVSGNWFLY